jgi:phosphoribosylamine--glycine ligase
MKVLIVGSGGREHALAWKCAQDGDEVIVAPGNAGTAMQHNVRNANARTIDELIHLAKKEEIDITIVGPETFLVNGIVDRFEENGLMCFGPDASAARLEGSKAFAKEFLKKHNIPTANYKTFTDLEPALQFVIPLKRPIVIKADGLCAGKGVVVAQTELEAKDAIIDFMQKGHDIVIEEFLEGEEVSFIVMTDGESILPLATSQDHKRLNDGDTGPNTGGMGAYSPAPIVTSKLEKRIMNEIIEPTLDNIDYVGFLYAGLMIGKDGSIKVIEFNCRLGDPEAQPIILRMIGNLSKLCLAAMNKELDTQEIQWDKRAALGVVLAAEGYPNKPRIGDVITGQWPSNCTTVFHAGTTMMYDILVTNGGRVLCVKSLGDTIKEARDTTYKAVENIKWDGQFYRRDIGHKAILKDK